VHSLAAALVTNFKDVQLTLKAASGTEIVGVVGNEYDASTGVVSLGSQQFGQSRDVVVLLKGDAGAGGNLEGVLL
jgi:hypothetical protein